MMMLMMLMVMLLFDVGGVFSTWFNDLFIFE